MSFKFLKTESTFRRYLLDFEVVISTLEGEKKLTVGETFVHFQEYIPVEVLSSESENSWVRLPGLTDDNLVDVCIQNSYLLENVLLFVDRK